MRVYFSKGYDHSSRDTSDIEERAKGYFFYRPVYEIFELTELQYKDSERENFESANVIAGNEREKVVHIGEIPPGLYYIKIVSVNYSNVDYCFSVN